MMTPTPPWSKNFIIKLFTLLNNAKISYVVLRNYDGLPESVGHDIDLLISEERYFLFNQIFRDLVLSEKGAIIETQSRYGFNSFIIISNENCHAIPESLKWDIWKPITWMGIPWINSNKILTTNVLCKQLFYIPSAGAECATLLLKDLIQGKEIKNAYHNRIHSLFLEDPQNFSLVLLDSFDRSFVEDISEKVQNEDWQGVEKTAPLLKKTLLIRAFRSHPVRSISSLIQFGFGHVRDYIEGRNRVFLCFIGPDGSGKSTISSMVLDAMKDICETRKYYHGHFNILPPLSLFFPGKERPKSTVEEIRHDTPKSLGSIPTAFMMLYYTLDYLLGFFLIAVQRRQFELVIFDRYYYDYIIQPGPFNDRSILYRALLRIIPKPDIIVFLKSPPAVIYQRKPELTIPELTRQIEVCNHIVDTLPDTLIMDNTHPKEIVVNKIRSNILQLMRGEGKNQHAT